MGIINKEYRRTVFEFLANACEGGYETFLNNHSAEEIAEDLKDCTDACEEIPQEELIVLIDMWKSGDRL